MKIGPPPPPVLPLPRPDEAASQPGDRRGGRGTFCFDELGVFGLNRGRPGEGGDRGGKLGCPMPDGRAPDGKLQRSAPDRAPPPNGAPAPAPGPAARRLQPPPLPRPIVQVDQPEPHPRRVEIGEGGHPLELAVETIPEPAIDGKGAAGTRPPSPVRETAASVVVREKDGRLSIAAASAPLDGKGRALLKRLVREILAGRGLAVADFKLNGTSLTADFLDMTGGSHGTRAR